VSHKEKPTSPYLQLFITPIYKEKISEPQRKTYFPLSSTLLNPNLEGKKK
jgi:hypothetical protein